MGENYQIELSELQIEVWRQGLADLSTAQLDAAFSRMIRTVESFPNVAVMRRMVLELEESDGHITPHVWTRADYELEKERLFRKETFERLVAEGKAAPLAQAAAAGAPAPAPLPPSKFGSLDEQKAELKKRGFLK